MTRNTNARVSVVLDTYNHEAFIEDAIRSVLDQNLPRDQMEILVVDDGSTDRTPDIVRKFEPVVRLLRKQNGGQASAINYGVALASGEFVAFLDGDDVWLPNKLSRVLAEFERCPQAVLVYHNFWYWDSTTGSTRLAEHFREVAGDVISDARKLLSYSAAPTSSLVFRRSALQRVLPVPEPCHFIHDAYLVRTVVFLGRVAALSDPLTKYRMHGQNLYFAARLASDTKPLQRTVRARAAAIQAMWIWMRANVPRRCLPQARVLVRRMRLTQDDDLFHLKRPGRFRYFLHRVLFIRTYRRVMARDQRAYWWAQAILELILGPKHSRLLEWVRMRARRLFDGVRTGTATIKQTSETPKSIS